MIALEEEGFFFNYYVLMMVGKQSIQGIWPVEEKGTFANVFSFFFNDCWWTNKPGRSMYCGLLGVM